MLQAMKEADLEYERQIDSNNKLESVMEEKDKKIDDLQQDIYDTEGKYIKEKEDPNRLEKNNESI